MPIVAAKLQESTRPVEVPFNGETLTVVYRLGQINADFFRWYIAHAAEDGSLHETILRLVANWDLLGDDDQPLPVTAEVVAPLPSVFLRVIKDAIFEDAQPGKLRASISSAGSRPAEMSARVQPGTRGSSSSGKRRRT